ncbi:sulfur carrier protein ThiS [Trichloromonas sp.]|uniref:sulfur carrier protein ThiS n=1 Tax=Trichloromonas sp. TaxID=3069249 RepID=UPI003D81BD4B
MKITVNGKPKQLDAPITVSALLEALQLDGNRVAIELNRNVLLKEQFAATSLQDGDAMEIVQFVGGG